jgi:hypothetical protein
MAISDERALSTAHGARTAAEADVAGERRTELRQHTAHLASYCVAGSSFTVDLRDVSRFGVSMRIRTGLMVSVGQRVGLTLMNGQAMDAIVIWADGSDAGLEFIEPLEDSADALYFDDLGSDYFRAVMRLQQMGD